jgi:hypothetical protein
MSRTPGKSPAAAAQRRNAATFLADLTRLADRYSCATIGYDRPDDLAMTSSPFAKELTEVVDRAIDQLSGELAAISVEGPEALTLSSGTGQFPVTVGNRTPHRVRVTLGIDSSAPDVRFEAPRTVDVAAGESRTVTVNVDMESQTATTVSVRLSSAEGLSFGAATVFNVRSTRVGAALWIAIGLSVAFVAVALVRRFARPGHRPSHEPFPPDDFDD